MIKIIVGLGNPGDQYSQTRHNVGVWFVEAYAHFLNQKFVFEKKFKGQISSINTDHSDCWLLLPATFMNQSGQSVGALAKFYKIQPSEILVVHDELDFSVGTVRLKKGGGSGGHNGLKDIVAHLNSSDFYRLRIGIGHPGNAREVIDYVLKNPSKMDRQVIDHKIADVLPLMSDLLAGKTEKFMKTLHTTE